MEGLARGWYAFNFVNEEHLIWVLSRNWFFEQASVLLKCWHPMFDTSRERVEQVPIWVRLLGLPLPFWFEDHFTHIGNLLGTFMEADSSYKLTKVKRVACILVNINTRNGLPGVVCLS